MNELDDRHIAPYTLVCLYIKTLSADEREELLMVSDKYDRMRFHAKAMRALVEEGLVLFDWENMEATITPEGLQKAQILIQEISER